MITDKNRDFLTQYGSPKQVDELMEHPRTSMYGLMNNPAFNHIHIQKLIDSNHDALHEVTSHPYLFDKAKPEQITTLSKSSDPDVIAGLATKTDILKPEHVENLLNGVEKHKVDSSTLQTMGRIRTATPEQFDRMVGLNNHHVNQGLAANKNLPEKHIPKFMNSSIVLNRMNIAKHPKLTPEHMETLSNDENEFVRARVAARKDLPEHLVNKLKDDPSDSVRSEILTHHKK